MPFNGAYAELKYFLTGEHRIYDPEKAVFLSSIVHRNFHPLSRNGHRWIDGWGAWQAVLQWSYVDMGDWRTINEKAGRQHDLTAGMNWFWTPNIRWVFEYTHSMQNIGSSRASCKEDILATSLQLYF